MNSLPDIKQVLLFVFLLTGACFVSCKCIEGNCKNGEGTLRLYNKNTYKGEFKNYRLHGQGEYTIVSGRWKGCKYTGEFKKNKIWGKGVFYYKNGNVYEGEFVKNKISGKGTYTYANGNKYEGEWKKHKFHGTGTFTYAYGKVVSGKWRKNKYIGK